MSHLSTIDLLSHVLSKFTFTNALTLLQIPVACGWIVVGTMNKASSIADALRNDEAYRIPTDDARIVAGGSEQYGIRATSDPFPSADIPKGRKLPALIINAHQEFDPSASSVQGSLRQEENLISRRVPLARGPSVNDSILDPAQGKPLDNLSRISNQSPSEYVNRDNTRETGRADRKEAVQMILGATTPAHLSHLIILWNHQEPPTMILRILLKLSLSWTGTRLTGPT